MVRISPENVEAIHQHMLVYHSRSDFKFEKPDHDSHTHFSASKTLESLAGQLDSFLTHILPKHVAVVTHVVGKCAGVQLMENEQFVKLANCIVCGSDNMQAK